MRVACSAGVTTWQPCGSLWGSPAVGPTGDVFIHGENYIVAVTPAGAARWVFPVPNAVYSSLAIGRDSTVYYSTVVGGGPSLGAVRNGVAVLSSAIPYKLDSLALGSTGTVYGIGVANVLVAIAG